MFDRFNTSKRFRRAFFTLFFVFSFIVGFFFGGFCAENVHAFRDFFAVHGLQADHYAHDSTSVSAPLHASHHARDMHISHTTLHNHVISSAVTHI
jgi:hypothetical protein